MFFSSTSLPIGVFAVVCTFMFSADAYAGHRWVWDGTVDAPAEARLINPRERSLEAQRYNRLARFCRNEADGNKKKFDRCMKERWRGF